MSHRLGGMDLSFDLIDTNGLGSQERQKKYLIFSSRLVARTNSDGRIMYSKVMGEKLLLLLTTTVISG